MITYRIKDLKKTDFKNVVANFTLVLNDEFEVKGCKLFYSEKKDDYFVFFPSFKWKDKYYSYISCSSAIRHEIRDLLLKETVKPEITF